MPSGGFSGDDVFGVRVAALPATGLDGLRCGRAWALAQEVLELTAWLSAEGNELSGVLHEQIGRRETDGIQPDGIETGGVQPDGIETGGVQPDSIKPLLVGLRRAVYKVRRPDRPSCAPDVLDALPPAVAARIRTWLSRLDRRAELAGSLPGVLAADLATSVAALYELAADPAFRCGLAHSSADLCRELDKWIADQDRVPRRQVLARLARYAARMATKTSPYATFAISGLGRWADRSPAVTVAGPGTPLVVPEFDLTTVWRLWDAIIGLPELRDTASVRVNPSVTEHDGRLRFLAAGPGEALASVPVTPAVRRVLAFLDGGREDTLGAVGRAAGSAALAGALAETGVLEVRRPFTDQSADPLGGLLAWTRRSLPAGSPARPWLPRELGALHQTVTSQQAPGPARLAEISALTTALMARLGAGSPPSRQLCMHTAVAAGDLAVCGREAWRPVLDDLQALRTLLGLLDPDLPVKLAAADLFTSGYGPRQVVPFLAFYRLAHTTACGLRALIRREPAPGNPELRELRAQAKTAMCGQPDGDGVIRVEPELVYKLACSWPEYIRPPGSICCYGQALPPGPATTGPAGTGPGLVINAVYSGYGRHTGRIRYLLDRAGHPAPGAAPYPVADTGACFGTCVNLRPPAAADSIDYPFAVEPGRLPLAGLRVRYDQAATRLTLLDPAGLAVRPAHLGMSSELTLWPAWLFLIRVFGEPPVALPPSRLPSWLDGYGTGPVRRKPRLTLGSVTIARAHWQLSAGEFPVPAKGETDAAYLLRAAGWLREHDIPPRFFGRVLPASERQPLDKRRKPLYVDAASFHLLTSFARAIGDPDGTVVLEEVLPDPADAPRYGPDGPHVTEYVFGVSGDPG